MRQAKGDGDIIQRQHIPALNTPVGHTEVFRAPFGLRYFPGGCQCFFLRVETATVNDVRGHAVSPPKAYGPYGVLQPGDDFIRIRFRDIQRAGERHILKVITVGHLRSRTDRTFPVRFLGDEQILPRIRSVIAAAHHLEIAEEGLYVRLAVFEP